MMSELPISDPASFPLFCLFQFLITGYTDALLHFSVPWVISIILTMFRSISTVPDYFMRCSNTDAVECKICPPCRLHKRGVCSSSCFPSIGIQCPHFKSWILVLKWLYVDNWKSELAFLFIIRALWCSLFTEGIC